MFKKKKEKKSASPVIFKKKSITKRKSAGKKRSSGISLKKSPIARSRSKRKKTKKSNIGPTLLKLGVLLVIPMIVIGIFYEAGKAVNQIRRHEEVAGVSFQYGEVLGFEEIPVYPDSEFIFERNRDSDKVKQFLNSGKSAYRLPPHTTQSDALEYYKENMEPLGWTHVLSVPFADEEKRYGEYWVKDKIGIRIYSQINDVWFEKLTVDEATTGLRAVVEKEVERELLLSASDGTELLPDFPWALRVPNEYLVSYSSTKFVDLRSALFSKLGSKEKVTLQPIGALDGTPFDTYLEQYISEINKLDGEDKWEVKSSSYENYRDRTTLISEISNGTRTVKAYSMPNYRSNYLYVLVSFNEESKFLDFVLQNLNEKRSGYTQEDYDYD
jgi:outer membrane protein assembly factor BamB